MTPLLLAILPVVDYVEFSDIMVAAVNASLQSTLRELDDSSFMVPILIYVSMFFRIDRILF